MSATKEIFTKVNSEDKSRFYRLKTEWEDGYFRLFILEDTNAWFALVTKEQIKKLSEERELESETYFNKVREYICNAQPTISFSIAQKKFIIYYCSSAEEKMRMKYFVVNLEKLNYQETVENVFVDELMTKYTEALEKVSTVEVQKLELEGQKMLSEKKLEQFVELKEKADLQMYGAFTAVLNEKKHRIRYLAELLDSYQTGGKQKVNTVTATSNTKKKKATEVQPIPSTSSSCRPKETISDSESNPSEDYNTDDEKNTQLQEDDGAVPGTSRDNFDFLEGDSPPPPSVPKRIKRDTSKTLVSSPSKDLKQKIETNGSKEEPMDTQAINSDDDSESFNTQDLLDRM